MKNLIVALLHILAFSASAQQGPRKIILNIDALYTYDVTENRQFYALIRKRPVHNSLSGQNDERFVIQKVNLNDFFTKRDSESEPFNRVDSEKIMRDSIIYFLSGFSVKEEIIAGKFFDYKKLFPGESILVNVAGVNDGHHFYSTGRVVASKDTSNLEVFTGINNYRLAVRTQRGKRFIDQTIFKMDMNRWSLGDYLGGISLNWMGDLDGDGELDIIVSTCAHHECYEIRVFSFNKKGWVYEKHVETVCSG